MPELPEVETIVNGLRSAIIGRHILATELSGKKMRVPIPENFAELVIRSLIKGVSRKAKYILIHLNNNFDIVIHLGMSGKVLVGTELPRQKHDHAVMTLDNNLTITFNDPRRFGLITCLPSAGIADHPLFKNLGIEPLEQAFTGEFLLSLFKKRTGNIKSLIMNGNLIVGVGNIYASESLFASGIHPLSIPSTIPEAKAELLANTIKEVLRSAIESGGSTLRDYVRASGDVGGFQHKFKVYGKNGQACSGCGTSIERLAISGRSTFFCASCQTLY